MQFGSSFIGKTKTFAKDNCAEGKSGDDIKQGDCKSYQKALISMHF